MATLGRTWALEWRIPPCTTAQSRRTNKVSGKKWWDIMPMNYDYNTIFTCTVVYSGVLLMSWGCYMLCNGTKKIGLNLIYSILYTQRQWVIVCLCSPLWTVGFCLNLTQINVVSAIKYHFLHTLVGCRKLCSHYKLHCPMLIACSDLIGLSWHFIFVPQNILNGHAMCYKKTYEIGETFRPRRRNK